MTEDLRRVPDHLSREQIERQAEAADSLLEFTRECRISRERGRVLLSRFGVAGEIPSTQQAAAAADISIDTGWQQGHD